MALTAKQEGFCRGVAIQNLSLSDAYRANYDVSKMTTESINTAAKQLAASLPVATRLDVLRQRATEAVLKKAGLTLEAAMAEAGALLEDAKALGQISAGVAAATLRAKLAGLLIEKKEVRTGALEEVDLTKLAHMREQAERDLKAAEDAASVVGEVPTPAAPVRRAIG